MIMQGALIVFTGCIIYYLINQIYSVVRFRNKYIQEKVWRDNINRFVKRYGYGLVLKNKRVYYIKQRARGSYL